jgi:hypothetical protein
MVLAGGMYRSSSLQKLQSLLPHCICDCGDVEIFGQRALCKYLILSYLFITSGMDFIIDFFKSQNNKRERIYTDT